MKKLGYKIKNEKHKNIRLRTISYKVNCTTQDIVVAMVHKEKSTTLEYGIVMDRHIADDKVLENHPVTGHLVEHTLFSNFEFKGEYIDLAKLSSKINKTTNINGFTGRSAICVFGRMRNTLDVENGLQSHGVTTKVVDKLGFGKDRFKRDLLDMIDAINGVVYRNDIREEDLVKEKAIVRAECSADIDSPDVSWAVYETVLDMIHPASLDGIDEIDIEYVRNYARCLQGRIKYITITGDINSIVDAYGEDFITELFDTITPTHLEEIIKDTDKLIGLSGDIYDKFDDLLPFTSLNRPHFKEQGYIIVGKLPVAHNMVEVANTQLIPSYLVGGLDSPFVAKFREDEKMCYGVYYDLIPTSGCPIFAMVIPCDNDMKLTKIVDNKVIKFCKEFTTDLNKLTESSIARIAHEVGRDLTNPNASTPNLDGHNSPYQTHALKPVEWWSDDKYVANAGKYIGKRNLAKLAQSIDQIVHGVKIIKVSNKSPKKKKAGE